MDDDEEDYERFDWTDIEPIAQNDGDNPLVQIMYSQDYVKATGLLRAVMAKNERTPRVLALTEAVIEMNPAHYTVWHYRLETLRALTPEAVPKDHWLPSIFTAQVNKDFPVGNAGESLEGILIEDYEWLNSTTMQTAKNYQIWHYRQCLKPSGSNSDFANLYFAMERYIVELILNDEAKNYHAWSHLQWVVNNTPEEFQMSFEEEITFIEWLLSQDVFNNSAWSYRFFILSRSLPFFNEPILSKEIQYCQFAISEAPQNESVWNYLVALYDKYFTGEEKEKEAQKQLEELCLKYAPIDTEEDDSQTSESVFRSTHALEILVTVYEKQKRIGQARKTLALLQTYLPMRKGYLSYRAHQLDAISAN